MLHEQHSDAPCSTTWVSGIVLKTSPLATLAPWVNPLKVPCERFGKPAPVDPAGMEHVHEAYSARLFYFTCPSLVLSPVWANATAESPRMMRVCFILSNLKYCELTSLLYRSLLLNIVTKLIY